MTPSDGPAAPAATRRSSLARWGPRLLVWGLVLAIVAASLAGFAVARRVVSEQERRALTERAATVEASLSSSEQSTGASLRVLAGIASAPGPDAASIFERVARNQLSTASSVGAARLVAGRYVVIACVGGLRKGSELGPDRAATLAKARRVPTFVVSLIEQPRRLMLALAQGDVVVFQESPLAPEGNVVPSPFGSLDLALYAAPEPERELLVFATAPLPLPGAQVSRPFLVGPDRWLLVVSSDDPLAGSLTRRVPWFVLGGGLLAALLVGAVVATLARRRSYALRMVAERTADLEEAKRFQESLLTAGPMMVGRALAPDLTTTYVSPNASRILGLPSLTGESGEAEAGNVRREDWTHPDDLPRLQEALRRVGSGEVTSTELELRARTGSESYLWVSTLLVAEREPGTDEVTAVLSYVLDIDDRKRAEEALRAAQEAAESANQAKSQFLSRMSHELRTPMNAVLGFGQLLELDDLDPRQRESVSYILKAGRHLLRLIDEVLDISRIESGTMTLSPEPVLPSDVITEALRLVHPMAQERQVQLLFDAPDGDEPHVLADHHRLKQVLLNLLSNAVKYNVHGGVVTVSTRAVGTDRVRIDVADTGPGIPESLRALLFTPFQRLGAEQGQVEGTGIGLALSRQLAEAMGGSVELVDTPSGSTFRIDLPRTDGPASRTALADRPDQEREPSMSPAPRACILQIEDNPSNARLMERLLEDRTDVELVVAPLGRLGVQLARERLPKLVLLDLHLPDLHGEDVLRELRADAATADIPVVVVSADGTHGQERRLREAGAHAYLTKPFDIGELLALIDSALAGSSET